MNFMREVNTSIGSRGKERSRQLDQSRQPARAPTQAVESKSVVRNRKNQKSKRYHHQEQKLQQHRDREDRRVHDLTEGIRNDFLPSAFNVILPQCEDPKAEFSPERCRIVAAAALCVAALMNAPPWFFDFLTRVPWRQLKELEDSFSDGHMENYEWLNKQLDVCEEERNLLVNTPVHSSLMYTILEFVYQDEYQESVPPMLRPSSGISQNGQESSQMKGGITLESVAALLDGATPLHCAAIRGNPAQINHLLQNGGDPTIKTVCGDLPIELVPVCGDKNQQTGQRSCRCMRMKEQEMWECRSGLARNLIFKKCLLHVRIGLVAWFQLILICILNWFAMWGYSTCLCSRPIVHKHVGHRQDQKRREAKKHAQSLLNRMRLESRQGHSYLEKARKEAWRISDSGDSEGKPAPKVEPGGTTLAEEAFRCFVRAVHALQNLDLQGGTIPQGFMDASAPPLETSDCQVLEDEQADLYCCWAESVLLKFRDCRCAGCAALAVQAIRMAHIQVARLFTRVEKKQDQEPSRWRAVGQALMRVVHVHICLLLDTEAKASATRASVWRAEHCLKEWERLRERGLQVDVLLVDELQVHVLDKWAKTADSNLILGEALHGTSLLPSQTLTEVLESCIAYSPAEQPYLARSISDATILNLEMALKSASMPSPALFNLTQRITENAKQEIKAAEGLRKAMNVKGTSAFYGAVENLSEAIQKAEAFPHLLSDIESAQALREQWVNRAEAVERLESVMMQARQPIKKGRKLGKVGKELQGFGIGVLESSIKLLEGAIEEAKESNIGVDKARRLLKELQAQAAAVEAANHLDSIMAKKPCGSGVLRASLTKAESACTSASGNSGIGSPADFLLPRIQQARKRLDVEKAVEALGKATTSCRAVTDLAKLEAMILAARSVGAEELDPKVYQAASEQRSKLHNGSRIRQSLEAAVKNLRKQQKQEDAEALERALEEARQCRELVEDEASKAESVLEQWKSLAENEAKLMKVVQEGSTAEELSHAITEAASAGVKVQAARRILKFMQNLEASMRKAAENPSQYCQLQKQVKAAEIGGVNQLVVGAARGQLKRILVIEAKAALERVLEEQEGLGILERCTAFRSALSKASEVVDVGLQTSLQDSPEGVEPSSQVESTLKEGSEAEASLIALAKQVNHLLKEDEGELQKVQAEREEQERLRQVQLEKERMEKERLESERMEKERIRKEQREKRESERKEREKAERERKQREKQRQERELAMQLVQDKQRRDRPRQDRFRRRGSAPSSKQNIGSSVAPYMPEVCGHTYSQIDPSSSDYDWEASLAHQTSIASADIDLSKLMELSREESGLLSGRAELHSSSSRELSLLDLPRPMLGGGVSGAQLGDLFLPSNETNTAQPNWAMDSTPTLGLLGPDFSIGTSREQAPAEETSDGWELGDGLRDIQASHNAPYYGMHVDLINSLAPRSSDTWVTPQISSNDVMPDMDSRGHVPDDGTSYPMHTLPLSSMVDYQMRGDVGLGAGIGMSNPSVPSLPFKLNSVWAPDADLNLLRSQSFSSSMESSRHAQLFQQSLGQDISGYDMLNNVESSSIPSPTIPGGASPFIYGGASCGPNSPNLLLSVSLPQPVGNMLPMLANNLPSTSLGGVFSQQCQSPFPGVGVGIPGSANRTFTGPEPHLRTSSLSLLETEQCIFPEEHGDDAATAQSGLQDNSRSHLI